MASRIPVLGTVEALVAEPSLALLPLVDGDERATRPISWIASSDLADPTPFLAPDHVLLTTGRQLVDDETAAPRYVRALVDAGVLGIGFGTGLHARSVPPTLVAAAREADLPLFEVPYDTSFLAIIRWNAERGAARERWASEAQRAVGAAASRADAPDAVVRTLARELGADVALLDARARLRVASAATIDGALAEEARAALRTGRRTARTTARDDGGWMLVQSLGAGLAHGVLALTGSTALDAAARSVVTTAATLLDLALSSAQPARDRLAALESAIVDEALAGDAARAGALLARAGEALPTAPVVVAAVDGRVAIDADAAGPVLVTTHHGGTVVVAADADRPALAAALADATVGWSAPAGWDGASAALAQATTALARARRDGLGSATFAPGDDGILGLLADDAARAAAIAHLGDLLTTDEGRASLALARVWFAHDCAWDAAARAAGMHRHSLRDRILALGRELGLDLHAFADRATLWAWLQATAEPSA
ncbi:PucR family transcriptional regulator ligand-binding domain-containing protein [Agrococcus sp. SGAir0287]|uniref:PucR family transcriptional regulator ligand-binding domain-containing protein n=1 Tax=Agrococcus sp. SGAir0287 TaxID=2070347 RepID=UPI001586D5CC|nr:PucR family transcriptional regulator ligand-binding domain-containing protein [Agrococcus sp. SGAir0287]